MHCECYGRNTLSSLRAGQEPPNLSPSYSLRSFDSELWLTKNLDAPLYTSLLLLAFFLAGLFSSLLLASVCVVFFYGCKVFAPEDCSAWLVAWSVGVVNLLPPRDLHTMSTFCRRTWHVVAVCKNRTRVGQRKNEKKK